MIWPRGEAATRFDSGGWARNRGQKDYGVGAHGFDKDRNERADELSLFNTGPKATLPYDAGLS